VIDMQGIIRFIEIHDRNAPDQAKLDRGAEGAS
jgi:hypothetical protein